MILNVKLITGEKLTFKVDKSTCIIGRSGQCDVVIPHEAVSRKHCQIDYQDGELYVTDLGSINGVLIDGQKIPPNKPEKFQSFLTLSFGAVQTLNVELEEEHTSVQPNPLLATTLQPKSSRPKMQKLPQRSTETSKKETPTDDSSMTNFITLCVMVIIGFAVFIFKDELLSLVS